MKPGPVPSLLLKGMDEENVNRVNKVKQNIDALKAEGKNPEDYENPDPET